MRTEPTMRTLRALSNDDLVAAMQRLAGAERESMALLVAHLAEFDARSLHLAAGFPSLFLYCREILRLSEHEAYNRIEAARLARSFPRVLDMIGEGALNLTTARLLGPHLNDGNHEGLLAAASGKSKREVEELLVRYFPKPAVPSSIRRLAAPKPAAPRGAADTVPDPVVEVGCRPGSTGAAQPVARDEAPPGMFSAQAVLPAEARRELVRPLTPDRYEIRFTATAETCEKLRVAKDLLRHAVPDGDMAEIVDRALTLLLEDLARKKFAVSPRPRANQEKGPAGRPDGRHIPAAVKRAVWLRDGGRCAFVGQAGRRCTARGFLEFHHVRPYGVGGVATAENIQIRCRAHNAYEADLFYGRPQREAVATDGVTNSLRNEFVGGDAVQTKAWVDGRASVDERATGTT